MFDISGLNNTKYTDLISAIQGSLNLVIAISALITVGMLVYSGYKFIMSSGDETKIEEAQKVIVYSLIGLIIVFIAPIMVRFILTNLLGQV